MILEPYPRRSDVPPKPAGMAQILRVNQGRENTP